MPRRRGRMMHFLRRVLLVGIFACALFACRWLAYLLRFDADIPEKYQVQLEYHWPWVISMQLVWLAIFGQFSGIYKYFSLPEIRRLGYAMIFSAYTLFGVLFLDVGYSPPRGVILIQCMAGFLALGAMRAAWRLFNERYSSRHNHQRIPIRSMEMDHSDRLSQSGLVFP